MKNARQKKIVELVTTYDIDTQQALIDKLSEAGFAATQTTISRDINQLKLVKAVSSKGGYKYIIQGTKADDSALPVMNSALKDAVLKIEAAKNIVVVKTLSGMANAVAVCVDSLKHDDIVGSVAGDDTILLVIKTDELAKEVEESLLKNFMLN
jgi:transcriptional regulator of arginine metabolism